MKDVAPRLPNNLDPLAVEVLGRLQDAPEAVNVILGGGVALQHFLVVRATYDVDGWWSAESTLQDRAETLDRIRVIAGDVAGERDLTVSERKKLASEVVSIELQREKRTVFSFQIAERDVELEPPIREGSPWAPVAIEALADNLGSKMSALVIRGAPRDFVDVHAVVAAGIVTSDELWDLWEQKNPGLDRNAAKARVARNLSSIELRRPIEIVPEEDRSRVEATRAWVATDLVRPNYWRAPEPPAPAQEGPAQERGLDE